jgi:hypothetical protein
MVKRCPTYLTIQAVASNAVAAPGSRPREAGGVSAQSFVAAVARVAGTKTGLDGVSVWTWVAAGLEGATGTASVRTAALPACTLSVLEAMGRAIEAVPASGGSSSARRTRGVEDLAATSIICNGHEVDAPCLAEFCQDGAETYVGTLETYSGSLERPLWHPTRPPAHSSCAPLWSSRWQRALA